MAVVIHSFPYLIRIMTLLQLIFQSHWFMMIYLMIKLKHPRPSKHFNPSWWLCQVLTLLGLVSLPIMKIFNHLRLLITHMYALKINLTHRSHFLHLNCTIPSLMHWRNLTLQALVHDVIYLFFFRFLACHSKECAYASKLHAMSHINMISPWASQHALALTYVMRALWNTKCGCLHCYIFLACWFTQLGCSRTKPSSTWVNQCASGCIGNIISCDQAHAPIV